MFNFYIPEGKKLVDFKPKHDNYKRAYVRIVNKLTDRGDNQISRDDMKKLVFIIVKMVGTDIRDIRTFSEKDANETFLLISVIKNYISLLTPREFMGMFPIDKYYDGAEIEMKDYWSTMEAVNKIGIDNKIGENAIEFLWGYQNWSISFFEVASMEVLSRLNILQGGKDILLEFFEEQGIPLQTYHEENGNVVDDETGEIVGKAVHTGKKVTKLFSV